MTAVLTIDPTDRTADNSGATGDARLDAAMAQVRELADAAVDAVIPQAGLRMVPASQDYRDRGADPVFLLARDGEGDHETALRVLDGAHEQIANKLDIDLKYYRKMLADEPSLLAANVNRWLYRAPEPKRLLRMVKPLAQENRTPFDVINAPLAVRAYLSDSYKSIDHLSVLKMLEPELTARNARVDAFELTPKKVHIRVIAPIVDLGPRYKVGEAVAFGVSLRNSETGHSSALVELFVKILRCGNGMTVDTPLRIAHLGKRQEEDAAWMSDQTKRLTDAADILKLRDRVRLGFADESVEKMATAIAKANGQVIPTPEPQAFLRFVTNVGQRYDLSKAEVEALEGTTVEEIMGSGRFASTVAQPTQFTVAQAFTALARNTADFDRKVEVERIGWKVLTDPLENLLRAGKAHTN